MPGLRMRWGATIGCDCGANSGAGSMRRLVVVMCFPFGDGWTDSCGVCYGSFGYVCILAYRDGDCQADCKAFSLTCLLGASKIDLTKNESIY